MDYLELDERIREALREDLGRGDITTGAILGFRSGRIQARAAVIAKQELVLAGWPVFTRVFETLGAVESRCAHREGEKIAPGTIGWVGGEADLLLKGERVALNLLQRMCGIATATRRLVDLVSHTKARILDTRKTTPLWRSLDKYAVRIGGGRNHRMGLDDAVLIKENHIALAGGIEAAIAACREASHLHKVEIEVQDASQMERAIAAGADVVMLDNMSPAQVREAVVRCDGRRPLEVSGGVGEETIVAYAETGVDFISVGSLTHSFRSADISLLIETSQ